MPYYSDLGDKNGGYHIPRGLHKDLHVSYRSIRVKVGWVTFFLALLVGCYALKSYVHDIQQKVDNSAAEYNALHWRSVDAKIIQLGPITGTDKPIKQSVIVEYPQGEMSKQLTLDVQLGYHQNDLVQLYVNDKGEHIFRIYETMGVTHFSTFTEFWGDFFTTWLFMICIEILLAWAFFYFVIMGFVISVYSFKSSKTISDTTTSLS